jgi:hypothetical protein
MFSAYAPSTATATITVTWNQPTTTRMNDLIDEFSGVDGTTIAVGNNSATGTGTATVSVTPTANDTMIWNACNDTVTAVGTIGGTTATKGADDTQSDWSQYRQLSSGSSTAQSCTFTGSGNYIIGGVALNPAGIRYVKSTASQAFPTTTSSLGTSFTPGAVNNIICVAAFASTQAATMSIADTSGIVWLPVTPLTLTNSGSAEAQSWYGYAKGTSPTTITITFSAGNFNLEVMIDEFSGVAARAALDKQATSTGAASTATVTVGPVTLGANGELIWAVGNGGAITGVGTGYTRAQQFDVSTSEYQILGSSAGASTAFSPSFATNSAGTNYTIVMGTFALAMKARSLLLLGCGS